MEQIKQYLVSFEIEIGSKKDKYYMTATSNTTMGEIEDWYRKHDYFAELTRVEVTELEQPMPIIQYNNQ